MQIEEQADEWWNVVDRAPYSERSIVAGGQALASGPVMQMSIPLTSGSALRKWTRPDERTINVVRSVP